MQWDDIRTAYPDKWLIVEAIEASTTPDQHRHLSRLSVVELCDDGGSALARYRNLHQQFPEREFYFVHTSRSELNIIEPIPSPNEIAVALCLSGVYTPNGVYVKLSCANRNPFWDFHTEF